MDYTVDLNDYSSEIVDKFMAELESKSSVKWTGGEKPTQFKNTEGYKFLTLENGHLVQASKSWGNTVLTRNQFIEKMAELYPVKKQDIREYCKEHRVWAAKDKDEKWYWYKHNDKPYAYYAQDIWSRRAIDHDPDFNIRDHVLDASKFAFPSAPWDKSLIAPDGSMPLWEKDKGNAVELKAGDRVRFITNGGYDAPFEKPINLYYGIIEKIYRTDLAGVNIFDKTTGKMVRSCLSFYIDKEIAIDNAPEPKRATKDYIDWSKIPEKYKFAVVDQYGGVRLGYSFIGSVPYRSDDGKWHILGGDWSAKHEYDFAIISKLPEGKDSLIYRPKIKKPHKNDAIFAWDNGDDERCPCPMYYVHHVDDYGFVWDYADGKYCKVGKRWDNYRPFDASLVGVPRKDWPKK